MQLKINRVDFVDKGILLMMYLQLVILEFYGYRQMLNKIICIFILVRLITRPKKISVYIQRSIIVLLCIFVGGALINSEWSFDFLKSNFLMQFYPFIYVYYIFYLIQNKSGIINEIYEKSFYLFNITYIINVIVLFFQIFKPYSITAVITSEEILFYEDTISGLFAYCSTHVLCLFFIFIIIYNIEYRNRIANDMRRVVYDIYILSMVVLTIFISNNNDNKAYFILLPIALVLYYGIGIVSVNKKWIMRILMLVLGIFILVLSGYMLFPNEGEILIESFSSIIAVINESFSKGNNAVGSGERIAMLAYALQQPSTWMFGEGFAKVFMYTENFHGFRHFGQADLGTLLIFGGIWYTCCFYLMYASIFADTIVEREKKEKLKVFVFVLILIVSISIYTKIFTTTNTMMTTLLIILVFRSRFQSLMVRRQNLGRSIYE